jgi:hypothetical protein
MQVLLTATCLVPNRDLFCRFAPFGMNPNGRRGASLPAPSVLLIRLPQLLFFQRVEQINIRPIYLPVFSA